jgi:hypothetical protein
MNTLPCETCLVFPLCKQRVRLTIQDYFTPLDCIIGLKCPFLMAFLFDNNDNAHLRKIVIRHFGLNPHLDQTFWTSYWIVGVNRTISNYDYIDQFFHGTPVTINFTSRKTNPLLDLIMSHFIPYADECLVNHISGRSF